MIMIKSLLIALLLSLNILLYAQSTTQTRLQDTSHQVGNKGVANSKEKAADKLSEKAENKPAVKSEKTEENVITQPTDAFSNWLKLLAVVGLLAVMIWGLILIFGYVKDREIFIGHNTIKLIAFVILLPSICVLSLVSPNIIQGAVLATLLGTISGYVLSRNQENDNDKSIQNTGKKGSTPGEIASDKEGSSHPKGSDLTAQHASEVDSLKKENNSLQKQLDELKAKIALRGD